jgi:hypothetical protein
MIKKHEHRKQNKKLLKLPKKLRNQEEDQSSSPSSEDEEEYDKDSLMKQKKSRIQKENASTVSRDSSVGTHSAALNKMTSLKQLKR